ncbi:MAG: metalloregulator ArsR/SmtB family transcription factor [Hungatella sp.]
MNHQELQQQFHTCMPLFIALGDEVRLSIIEALTAASYLPDGTCRFSPDRRGLNVMEITNQTKLSRPAVSYHLKILKDVGLVRMRKEGTSNYYYLTLTKGTAQLIALGSGLQQILEVHE